ncbi:MAG: membrane protein insertase YidC [Tannerellaceae bacterium]|jgi:YidC/Oxa1 family membrane protein insertase|nr:membrane protein insertase YidC [Tannerellaceae bacterium]
MDKNTVIGFALIGLVLVGFSWLSRPTEEQLAIERQQRHQDSLAIVERENKAMELVYTQKESTSFTVARTEKVTSPFAEVLTGEDTYLTLENEKIEVRISHKGGRVSYVRLKEYDNYKGEPVVLFEEKESIFDFTLVTADKRAIPTKDAYFRAVQEPGEEGKSISMRLETNEGNAYLEITYKLAEGDYRLACIVRGIGLNGILSPETESLALVWQQDVRQQEKGKKFEDRYAGLFYRIVGGDVDNLSEAQDASEEPEGRLQWIGFKDMFFSAVLVADGGKGFGTPKLESTVLNTNGYLKHYKAAVTIPFDLQGKEASELTFYFVPNKYALLKAYDAEKEEAEKLKLSQMVSLGTSLFRWINQYFILPIFDFMGKYIDNYGLIIFLLTIIVKLILFPLTYKSYISTAKMRVLRPQVEEINAQYLGQDKAVERQRATMDLYNRAGASPMSGCVPMLLQMPILIALFMFFPSAFELRHESFLWAKDLSTYDALVTWDAHIPLITPYFGNHISIFCLLMTATQIVYTKFNMEMTATGQQQMPGMKPMMYLMPLMMMFFFNEYASGLTYYYFISTLITIGQTFIFRYTIDEEKLLAKLEQNKRKPQKRSGFMKRLEEAQKLQEEKLRQQKQQRKR